jgi:hypothetical protein
MSLENLRRIGQLKEHPRDGDEWRRLLTAAERNLVDAHVEMISLETRFVLSDGARASRAARATRRG